MHRPVTLMFALALALLGASAAESSERRPFPDLVLTDLAGAPLSASDLPDTGHWLLVFVRPECKGCDALLEQMNTDERPDAPRIAIIVSGGSTEQAEGIKGRYANLAAARWLLDLDGGAAEVLRPPTAPTVWGVRNRMIEWDLAGALRGGKELESVLFSWLGRK